MPGASQKGGKAYLFLPTFSSKMAFYHQQMLGEQCINFINILPGASIHKLIDKNVDSPFFKKHVSVWC